MFIITNKQLQAFKERSKDDFKVECFLLLQNKFEEWFNGKDQAEVEGFVSKVIDFSDKYKIKSKANIKKLIALNVRYDFLNADLKKAELNLLQPSKDNPEDMCVHIFHKQMIHRNSN